MRCPITLERDYAVWDTLANRYRPAVYIADAQGRVRHQQLHVDRLAVLPAWTWGSISERPNASERTLSDPSCRRCAN